MYAVGVFAAEALETSPLVGPPLRELELPEGMRLGAIFRDGAVLKPSGSMKIKPKDRVIMLATAKSVKRVEQMFRVSLEFF
jgi:trk system potassium uptake protein